MTNDDTVFRAFSDFGIDDISADAGDSRRMLRRLAALASNVVAHAAVELENQLIELKKQLAQRK